MNAAGPLPEPAILLGLAQAALLDQIDRGDAGHARRRLLVDLGLALGLQATLVAGVEHALLAADGALHLPLRHLDQDLGALRLAPGAGLVPQDSALALACVTRPLAALLAREHADQAIAAGAAATASDGPGRLIRAALRGAGTFVWEWDIPSDRLGDIDEGFEQLGYPPSAARSTQQDWDALIHPDDRNANHAAYLRHASGAAASYEHSYRARAADGRWRWLQERGRIVEWCADGAPLRMVGTQVDITERRRAQTEAQAATARLHKIARHVPGALFQYQQQADGFGRFLYISERSAALFGLAPGEVTDDAAAMLRRIAPDERQAVIDSIAASAGSQQPWVREFTVHRRDGALRRIRAASTPQREADGSTVWHGYFEDVTEARALARARHDQRLAEAANRSKTEFLSRMSHELRTPLNAVLGFAQLMEIDADPPLPVAQRRRLALIRQSGDHLLALIDDLLDLTSIEAGRVPLALGAVALGPLVDDGLAMVQAAAGRHDLRLRREPADASAELCAWADRRRLRQVLLNLLTNAVKYNRPGGSVTVRLDTIGASARLQVQDTGMGLTPDECAHLFEPFNRLRQAKGEIEGTGIGLTLSRGLVTLMGGTIEVQSTPGVGSSFSVLLPLPSPSPLPVAAPGSAAS